MTRYIAISIVGITCGLALGVYASPVLISKHVPSNGSVTGQKMKGVLRSVDEIAKTMTMEFETGLPGLLPVSLGITYDSNTRFSRLIYGYSPDGEVLTGVDVRSKERRVPRPGERVITFLNQDFSANDIITEENSHAL